MDSSKNGRLNILFKKFGRLRVNVDIFFKIMNLLYFIFHLHFAFFSSGHLGDARGVGPYIGDDTGVKNLVVVARLRNASRSRMVRLLCNVSSGFNEGTMLKPSNAKRIY